MDVHPLFAGSLGVIPAGTHQDAHIVILYLRNYCGPTRIANYCTSVKTVLFHSLIPKINREWHNLEQIQIWLRTAASYSGDPSDNKAHQKTFNLDNLGILMLQWLEYQSPTTHTDTTHIYIYMHIHFGCCLHNHPLLRYLLFALALGRSISICPPGSLLGPRDEWIQATWARLDIRLDIRLLLLGENQLGVFIMVGF